jgi:hypothetical protein
METEMLEQKIECLYIELKATHKESVIYAEITGMIEGYVDLYRINKGKPYRREWKE